MRCNHEPDETCWHPEEVCDYWYSPFAHTVCAFGRGRKSRSEAEHKFVPFRHIPDWCDVCSRPQKYAVHV